MGGIHPIRNVLRIDNVETAATERITANDEDRQRQGFDIQTVFAWPRRAVRCGAVPDLYNNYKGKMPGFEGVTITTGGGGS